MIMKKIKIVNFSCILCMFSSFSMNVDCDKTKSVSSVELTTIGHIAQKSSEEQEAKMIDRKFEIRVWCHIRSCSYPHLGAWPKYDYGIHCVDCKIFQKYDGSKYHASTSFMPDFEIGRTYVRSTVSSGKVNLDGMEVDASICGDPNAIQWIQSGGGKVRFSGCSIYK